MRSLPALLLAALAAVPAASAAPTDLYLHLFGPQDMPMNTQAPPREHAADASIGMATSTLTCLPAAPGQSFTTRPYHTYYAYPMPGLVHYGEEGRPGIPYERGTAANVTVRGEPVLEWYLSTDGVPSGLAQEPAVVPRVAVAATLRTGSDVTMDAGGYNSGELLARGRSPAATLAGQFTEGAEWTRVGGRDVYGFRIPIAWEADPVLPHAQSFNLRIDVHLELPACDDPDRSLMANAVALHTSDGHRPRLRLDTAGPSAHVLRWHVEENATWTAFMAEVASPWGAYDLDLANTTLQVAGPAGPLPLRLAEPPLRGYEHGSATRPVLLAWLLDAPLPSGIHTATLRTQGLQHGGEPTVASYVVGAEEQPVPGPALPLLGLGVAAAAILARRR